MENKQQQIEKLLTKRGEISDYMFDMLKHPKRKGYSEAVIYSLFDSICKINDKLDQLGYKDPEPEESDFTFLFE